MLSDPRLDKKMYRLGWVIFKEGTDLDKILTGLGEIKVRLALLNVLLHIIDGTIAGGICTAFGSQSLFRDA